MKSYGRIAYDAWCEECLEKEESWIFLSQEAKDCWEAAADAVIEEYENKKPDPNDETT
jgi:hypothetical protein